MNLQDLLKKKLTKEQLRLLPKSYDIIGSREKAVAILELPKELEKKRKKIAEALMIVNKPVKTILQRASERKGIYRLRKLKLVAGSRNTEVLHIESGCRFLLDPKKVYFSQREGTERLRIAEKIKEGERIIIFFAGAGPFPIVIAKKAKPSEIVGIEINPKAVEYFEKNIRLNKLQDKIRVVKGNVKKVAKDFKDFDRVIMPLPETAIKYLPEAIGCLKSGGIVHLYFFASWQELEKRKEEIQEKAAKSASKIEFLELQKVLPYGPRVWKWRIDIRPSK